MRLKKHLRRRKSLLFTYLRFYAFYVLFVLFVLFCVWNKEDSIFMRIKNI